MFYRGTGNSVKKHPFSLVELLIVLAITVTIGSVFAMKGIDFVRNFQLKQEKQSFCNLLNYAYTYSKIGDVPVYLDVKHIKNKLIVQSSSLKLSRKFEKISLLSNTCQIAFYPHMAPSNKSWCVDKNSHKKEIVFDEKSGKFVVLK